jgi:hypothetical protein
MTCLLACALLGAAVAQTGFSAPLTFTGDAENDFAPGGVVKRGVIVVNDSLDVGMPPGPQWAGRVSGWDIKSVFFQFNTE